MHNSIFIGSTKKTPRVLKSIKELKAGINMYTSMRENTFKNTVVQ